MDKEMRLPGAQAVSLFSDFDIALFRSGKHYRLYEKLGSHLITHEGTKGIYFAVFAPNASHIAVVGDFNGWSADAHPMAVRWDESGIWELFIPGLSAGLYYKYHIESANGYQVQKGDPYATYWEVPPATASVTWDLSYKWTDRKWMKQRAAKDQLNAAISVYEVHIGSWRRPHGNEQLLSYRELAAELPAYCSYMGFTHVELMPVMEHPFYGSWGYQVSGYFAPSSRYGSPQDFMYLVDELHRAGIGVILDWVPSHFPADEHGLGFFDGTHLYEHEGSRGFHPDWRSYIFNYGRNEVRSFLISNALYWLDLYHIDGIRVDAVASMLYLDYSRKAGDWQPNALGGREDLDAVAFLQELNAAVHKYYPDVLTIAEESTAWSGVTRSAGSEGLGFDMKWMMGWMHDTLQYFSKDPVYRGHHQNLLTFSFYYMFDERFMLPLSHDEVVYGKGSMIGKMPGDQWQQFANLRLLYTGMYAHPGTKLLFMGNEFAQHGEWHHDSELDWQDNDQPLNQGLQRLVKRLNELYRSEPALYRRQFNTDGFEWIDFNDSQNSVLCWLRKTDDLKDLLLVIVNYTPVVRYNYRVGVPVPGLYRMIINSDNQQYGGSNAGLVSVAEAFPVPKHNRTHSLSLTLPPLGMVIFKLV